MAATDKKKADKHPNAPEGWDDEAEAAAAGQGASAAATPKNELPTVSQAKKQCCDRLTKIFSHPLMEERLMKMAGGDASRVAKNLTAFLSLITQDDGGSERNRKYLMECSISSLTACFLESMNMQLPFDSRKLISIVIYDYEAELDISYKGFINALCKHYHNAFVDAKVVFTEDQFECEESAGKVVFLHKQKDPFAKVDPKFINVRGAYCYFTYTHENGEKVERMVRASKDDLWTIRSKAKTTKVWDEFTQEQILKSIIRRASKIPFAAIDLDIDIEEVANRHFQLDKPVTQARIENLMKAQEEILNEPAADKKPDPVPKSTAPSENGQKVPDAAAEGTTVTSANKPGSEQPEVGHQNENETLGGTAPLSAEDFAGEAPSGNAPANSIVIENESPGAVWDGKTLYFGDGKKTEKDFNGNPGQAYVHLKKVISQRTHKATRRAIVDANPLLIAALVKDGHKSAIEDLNKTVEQGA